MGLGSKLLYTFAVWYRKTSPSLCMCVFCAWLSATKWETTNKYMIFLLLLFYLHKCRVARTVCAVVFMGNRIHRFWRENTRHNDIMILCEYCIRNVSMRFDNRIFIFHCTHQQFYHWTRTCFGNILSTSHNRFVHKFIMSNELYHFKTQGAVSRFDTSCCILKKKLFNKLMKILIFIWKQMIVFIMPKIFPLPLNWFRLVSAKDAMEEVVENHCFISGFLLIFTCLTATVTSQALLLLLLSRSTTTTTMMTTHSNCESWGIH